MTSVHILDRAGIPRPQHQINDTLLDVMGHLLVASARNEQIAPTHVARNSVHSVTTVSNIMKRMWRADWVLRLAETFNTDDPNVAPRTFYRLTPERVHDAVRLYAVYRDVNAIPVPSDMYGRREVSPWVGDLVGRYVARPYADDVLATVDAPTSRVVLAAPTELEKSDTTLYNARAHVRATERAEFRSKLRDVRMQLTRGERCMVIQQQTFLADGGVWTTVFTVQCTRRALNMLLSLEDLDGAIRIYV